MSILPVLKNLILFLVLFGSACAYAPRKGASKTLHQANITRYAETGIHWYSVTSEDFQKYILLPSYGDALPFDSVETLSLQALVDTIDQGLRQRLPEKLAQIPAPRVALTSSSEANAFVATVPLCFNNQVRLSQAAPLNSTNSTIAAVALDRNAHWQPKTQEKCLNPHNGPKMLDAIIKNFNETHTSCQIALNDGVIEGQAPCLSSFNVAGIAYAKTFIYQPFSNFIIVNQGLLRELDTDAKRAAVLAHELAHYYQAHATIGSGDRYNFYYFQSEIPLATQPMPDIAAAEIGKMLVRLQGMRTRPSIENQKFHTFLYSSLATYGVIGQFIQAECSAPNGCAPACSRYLERLSRTDITEVLRTLLTKNRFKAAWRDIYLETEQFFANCAETLPISFTTTTPQALTFEGIRLALAADFPELASTLQLPMQAKNLGHYLKELTAKAWQLESLKSQAQEEAELRHLGFYTTEQEADEIGLELLSHAGFDPIALRDVQESYLQSLAVTESQDRERIGASECLQLAKFSWIDSAGKAIFVPLGKWDGIYHSDCYRLFNIDREIKAHAYQRSII